MADRLTTTFTVTLERPARDGFASQRIEFRGSVLDAANLRDEIGHLMHAATVALDGTPTMLVSDDPTPFARAEEVGRVVDRASRGFTVEYDSFDDVALIGDRVWVGR